MIRIAYYDESTGRVVALMAAPNLDGMPDPQPGCLAVMTSYDGDLPAYWDGQAVRPVPERPSTGYIWQWSPVFAWVPDLTASRASAWSVVKRERDKREFAPFTYNGMTFDGDLDAQRRLSGLVSAAKSAIAAGHTFTKDFTLADNTVVQLTAEDFIGIEMAKLWQIDAAFQEYREKKARIDSATTLEDLEDI